MEHKDLLKVSRETKPAKLASAIYHILVTDETKTIRTRALGMEASHIMFKAIEKAQTYLGDVGLYLWSRFYITYEQLPGNEDVLTVYTLELMVLNK